MEAITQFAIAGRDRSPIARHAPPGRVPRLDERNDVRQRSVRSPTSAPAAVQFSRQRRISQTINDTAIEMTMHVAIGK
jgi:hypothetical protein